jgi:WD40 repeat protein
LDSKVVLQGHSRAVLAVAYLPDGKLLTAGVDATIRLWDASEKTPLRSFSNHTRPINALALWPGTSAEVPPMVASASDDRTVRFWQPTIGRLVRFARLDSMPLAIAWTPDGSTLWTAFRDGHVREIDPTDATVRRDYPAIEGPAYALAVAGDGTLAVGGSNGQIRRIIPKN